MEEKAYKYMVSVRCFTFNQSKYILDALNGFVMQQTNFPYVVMVVDDASTDGEQEVIRKFVTEQFDTSDTSIAYEKETDYAHITYAQHKTNKNCYIAVLYLKENHYSQRKPKMPYLAEWRDHVKYEALCEGDDYWIDAQKLQKQVDFLEEHEEYIAVAENAIVKNLITGKESLFSNEQERDVTVKELIEKRRFATASVLYRICIYDEYCTTCNVHVDTMLWTFLANHGKFRYFEHVSSVYNRGYQGVVLGTKPYNWLLMSEKWNNELMRLYSCYFGKRFFYLRFKKAILTTIIQIIRRKDFDMGFIFSIVKYLKYSIYSFLFIYETITNKN